MKNEKINLLFQIASVSAFFALFYIFKAELYYYAVKTAHTEFADLMMVRNNVFIPEYWAHITPRYILPVTILTIVGASFCGLLWKRSLFACGHIGLFVFWPKAEMSTTELTFTISLSVALILVSLITPAFSTSIIRGLNKRKKVSDKTAFDSKNTELIKG